MKISDYAKAQGWLKRHASSENSAGEWEKYVALNTTPELDVAIKTINDKFGPGTVFPASEAPIPPMTDQQAIFEFGQRNPKADGGQIVGKAGGLVEEGVEYYATKIYKVTTGSHKGDWALPEFTYDPETKKKSTKVKYFKSKTDLNNYLKETKTPPKYSKTELNKAAKFFYNLPDNDPRKVSSPKFDELDVKSREWNRVYDRVRSQKGKFSKVTQADALKPAQQAKILKEYPDAKFTAKNKYGFPPDHPNYQKVTAFVTRGYKKPFQGSQLQALPKYAQKELIEAFPEVEFNFDRDTLLRKGAQFSKYGVPVSHPKYSKIAKYFAKSKVWKYNFDLRSPEGWMMSQMERNYAQNGEASPYRPITKKGGPIAKGNPMIGIEHNGKKYYMDTINNHPDFNNTKKYWNIADKTSKKYLSEFDNLAKLVPEGFDPKKIQLNDLLQFISDKDGVQGLNRAKRAIQIHHEYGVGPRATTNYQLLRQDMNLLANKTNNLLKSKDLSKVEKGAAQALERNTRLVVDDVRYGPAKVSAAGDIKSIISQTETAMKNLTKKDWNKFSQLLGPEWCNQADGGRIGFKKGSGCPIDVKMKNFQEANERVRLGEGTMDDAAKIRKTNIKGVKAAGSLKALLGIWGLGGEALIEGAFAANEMMKGKSGREAWSESYASWLDPTMYEGGIKLSGQDVAMRELDLNTGEQLALKLDNQSKQLMKLIEQKDFSEAEGYTGEEYKQGDSAVTANYDKRIAALKQEMEATKAQLAKHGGMEANTQSIQVKLDDYRDKQGTTAFTKPYRTNLVTYDQDGNKIQRSRAGKNTFVNREIIGRELFDQDAIPQILVPNETKEKIDTATGGDWSKEDILRFQRLQNPEINKAFWKIQMGQDSPAKGNIYGASDTFFGETYDSSNYKPSNRFKNYKMGMFSNGGIASLRRKK